MCIARGHIFFHSMLDILSLLACGERAKLLTNQGDAEGST